MNLKRVILASVAVLLSCVANAQDYEEYRVTIDGNRYHLVYGESVSGEWLCDAVLNTGNNFSNIPYSISYKGREYVVTGIEYGTGNVKIPAGVEFLGGDYMHEWGGFSINYMDSPVNPFSTAESIVVDKENPIFDSRENCNAVISKFNNVLYFACKNSFIPSTVERIIENAFADIIEMEVLRCYAYTPPTTWFSGFNTENVTLYVPKGAKDAYLAKSPWNKFKEVIEISNTYVDEITINDIGKTTWCSEYDLDFTNVEGIKAYTATGYDNKSKTIWLTRVMTVPAGTGILVKGDAGTYKVPRSTEDAYYTNMFKGNTGDPIKIEETEGDMTNYYLSGKDGSFVSVNGSANIGKNKAYLQLPTKFFAGTRSIGVTYDDEGATGIWTIEQGTVNSEHDVWFNLQGQRVDRPRKGLYIKNGKKVFIK